MLTHDRIVVNDGGGGGALGLPDAVNKAGKHLGPEVSHLGPEVSCLGGWVKPASKEQDGFEQMSG